VPTGASDLECVAISQGGLRASVTSPAQSEGRGFFLGDYTGLVAVNGNKFLAVFIVPGTAGPGASTAVALQFSPGDKGDNAGGNPHGGDWSYSLSPADSALDDSPPWMGKKRRGGL